jgi:gas vesicle structural protein
MADHPARPRASVSEVLERVLDRGIVVDAWLRVSVAGLALVDVDAHIVIASLETYVQHAEAVAPATLPSPPLMAPVEHGTPAPAARRPRRSRVRLHCESGCTFLRSASRCPATVRCPSQGGRACPVTALAA